MLIIHLGSSRVVTFTGPGRYGPACHSIRLSREDPTIGTDASREPQPRHARSSVALLADRNFGPWFWGNIVSNSGNWLFNVTAAIVVFQLTGSALLVGMVSVVQFVPMVVLSPFAGAMSDRFDRKRMLLGSQCIAATAATAIALGAMFVGVENFPNAWPLLVAAIGIGTGQAIGAPALNALVPAIVEDADLEGAVALTALTFNIGRALGPASSGVLLLTVGANTAFVINAVTFLVFIGALLAVTHRPQERVTGADRSILGGVRYVMQDRIALLVLIGIGTIGFAADPLITLAPPLGVAIGGGEVFAAVLASAFGFAAIPAAAMSSSLQHRFGTLPIARNGALLTAAGLIIAATAPSPAMGVVGFAFAGMGFVLAAAAFTTVLQRRSPDNLRGRLMALWTIAYLGTRPLAATINGATADAFGPRWAMLLAISLALVGSTLAIAVKHRMDAPTPPTST